MLSYCAFTFYVLAVKNTDKKRLLVLFCVFLSERKKEKNMCCQRLMDIPLVLSVFSVCKNIKLNDREFDLDAHVTFLKVKVIVKNKQP